MIAHSVLSVIEAQRMRNVFQISLHRVFKANEIRGFTTPSVEKLWQAILSATLIHDLGKLTKNYQEGRSIRHHYISAIVARRALRNILGEFMSLALAYAIILHHEAIDWRSVEKGFLTSSYIHEVFSPTNPIIYEAPKIPLENFQQAIEEVLDALVEKGSLSQEERDILSEVQGSALAELKQSAGKTLRIDKELNAENLRDKRYQVPAMAVYRLIYLADNRAASARERYWLEVLSEVNWSRLDAVSEEILKRLSGKPYYIGLSSMP